ncbi:hypothetical protein [Candidatus Absconditicoccus praedator]|uniref:hypothetical protein n=1 Tax=Candidatus Absconditicoccus praedator TaxID=2735562 RepID=UPI001E366931|nr:hypothetical protein [Candidatus Absconditicoccus praedator]UFX82655.1 hypothetical protein HLG78_00690 [Candidatus Absconditicoccus praedator]
MTNIKDLQNLYEVNKTVRFELLSMYGNEERFDLEVFDDLNFLNDLLDLEKNIKQIEIKTDGKSFQNLLDNNILNDIIEKSFQILKNEICRIIYNGVVYDTKPQSKKSQYQSNLESFTGKNIDYFKPKGFVGRDYTPGEDFSYSKKSELFYSLKLIGKLAYDNDFLDKLTKESKEKLQMINKFNPNSESFFETFTLNPYTVNRWKLEEIQKKYKIVKSNFNKEKKIINNEGKKIINETLENDIFENKSEDKKIKYYKTVFNNILKSCDNNEDDLSHIYLLTNKIDSIQNDKKLNNKIEIKKNRINDLKRKMRDINKINSELLGYKIHLIDNFGIEKYSFLVQSENYYFLCQKNFEKLSDFLNYIETLKHGDSELIYIDSMTFWGFQKMFLSEKSDVKFTDGSNIEDLNKKIIELDNKIFETKRGIVDEYEKRKKELADSIKNSIENKETNDDVNKFLNFIGKENIDELVNKKGKFVYDKNLNEYCRNYFNLDEIEKEFDLENLQKQYLNLVIDLLEKIKDKKYVLGTEEKDLAFLGDITNFKNEDKTLEDFKNYFDDVGYGIETKNVDLDAILSLAKKGEIDIFQIKSKDMPYHESFVNENNCGITDTALNDKKLPNSKKDLQTYYFESFFEDIKNNNNFSRIGADYKIRGVNASANIGDEIESFWQKEKNQKRHGDKKDKINNFVTRFKRNRKYVNFFMKLNATNHNDFDEVNKKVSKHINDKKKSNKSLKVLSMDHGESSFLTYKIYEFKFEDSGGYSINLLDDGGNFDNFQLNTSKDKIDKFQNVIQEKSPQDKQFDELIGNYITKYHQIIQDQKRERQVQEGIKEFASKAISNIKEIVSNDEVDNNCPEVSKYTIDKVFSFINSIVNDYDIKNKNNIFTILEKNKFNYFKYEFYKTHPDQRNLKEEIDKYIFGIQELLEDRNKLDDFCKEIKSSFDGISESDQKKLENTEFFKYKNNFKTSLSQINNLKKGYSSAIIGWISKKIINNEIDLIVLENNILSYGVDNSKVFTKHMGTQNQSTFVQALINKLSFVYDKESKQSHQFCYPVKATKTKDLKDSQNGILVFVDDNKTSLLCPKCDEKLTRKKDNGNEILSHKDGECDFKIEKGIKEEVYDGIVFKNGDDLATYNIAKKGMEYIKSKVQNN